VSQDADAVALEAALARLLTDKAARAGLLADPAAKAAHFGLAEADAAALAALDPDDLELAARSFAHKRARQVRRPSPPWWTRLWR
jgi:hypothetical protein